MRNILSIIDHVSIQVENISSLLEYYKKRFDCDVLLENQICSVLMFNNINLDLVTLDQHPNYFSIMDKNASKIPILS